MAAMEKVDTSDIPSTGQPGFHHIAIEAGAGFAAPIGNTKKTQTFGLQHQTRRWLEFQSQFGVLLEYEFNRTGIPKTVLAASRGARGQRASVGAVGLDPIYYYKTTGAWGGYVTGGGGFYRKLTSFTAAGAIRQYWLRLLRLLLSRVRERRRWAISRATRAA